MITPHHSSEIREIRSLTCEQTVRRLWDYLDQQLNAVEMQEVDKHLHECKAKCASHFAFERAFLDLVQRARPQMVTSDALRLRVMTLVSTEGFLTDDTAAHEEG